MATSMAERISNNTVQVRGYLRSRVRRDSHRWNLWHATTHDLPNGRVSGETGVGIMPLVLVCESPPCLCFDVSTGKTGLDVANAGIHDIKGGLVYQMNVDALWV